MLWRSSTRAGLRTTVRHVLSLDPTVQYFEGLVAGSTSSGYWKTFERLLAVLRRSRTKSVFAGALAMGAHGVLRSTEDIDVLVHPDHRNKMLAGMQGFQVSENYDTLVVLKDVRTGTEVDVLVPFDSISLSALSETKAAVVRGHRVKVPTAEVLVAMKCVAGVDSPAAESKQRADVEAMVRKGVVDVNQTLLLLLHEAGPEYARFLKEAVAVVKKTPTRTPPRRRG